MPGKPTEPEAWDTVTGLIDDVDGWIKRAYFGFRDEYSQIAGVDSPMMIFVIVNEEGDEISTQGYSVGSGWVVQEDGARIEHPLRNHIVKNSVYGQLITRVTKDLKVLMNQYGSPLEAASWESLGFHWMQEEHATVSGEKRTAPMPTEFLGEKEARAAVAEGELSPVEQELVVIAKSSPDIKAFQKAALRLERVSSDDELMSKVLDDTNEGLYAKLKGK